MMTEAMVRVLEDTPAPAPSRRRRRLLTTGIAVVVLAAAVGAVLVHRSITRELLTATEGTAMYAFPGDDVEDPFRERRIRRASYQHGETYTFEFTINNPSRWDARVSGFPVSNLGMLEPVSYAVDTTPFDSPDRAFTPFRPFTIPAGGSAVVRVTTRFVNCDRFHAGHSATVVSFPVRYRALWASRTSDIELPIFIQVDASENC